MTTLLTAFFQSRARPRAIIVPFMIALTAAGILTACGRADRTPAERTAPVPTGISTTPLAPDTASDAPDRESARRARGDVIAPGTGRVTASLPPVAAVFPVAASTGTGETYTINLSNASIPEAARAVLGDTLGLTYSLEPGVEGRISLETSRPLDRKALFDSFQTSLEFNGATISKVGSLYTIQPVSRAAPQFVAPGSRRALGRRIVIVPLRFIAVAEMLRILEPIVSENAVLVPNQNRNLLMVSGSTAELEAVVNAVNIFDIDVIRGKSVALFRLRAASPKSVADELSRIFETGSSGSLEGALSFIPNERLGSILVITSRAAYLRDVRKWIEQLDETANRIKRHSVVYPLENRSADELLPVISTLVGAWANAIEVIGEGERDELLLEGGKTVVVSDDASNAIVAWATGPEHEELAGLITRLDATPAQVLIEATIAEVSLNDELSLGVRWFFESGRFSATFSDLANGAVRSSFPGFSFLFDSGSASVALNALSSVTDVNVVSTPSLLVLDNREAELRVGDQVPVATQSAVDASDPDAPIVNTISFRDTGVILKIRPRVSTSGRVIMDIEQEVSDVVNTTTSGIDSPTISQRLLRTAVAVDSGQTLALGGLIQNSKSRTNTKVPLIGDIPVIGQLFRNKEDDEGRSELLILITPKVVRDGDEARQITEEYRKRVSRPAALIRGGTSSGHQLRRLIE